MPEVDKTRRDFLENGLQDAYREADRLIVTVSSGILALSVAFLGGVNKPAEIYVLNFAWSFLLLAIISTFSSIWVEQYDKRRRINEIDDNDKKETAGKTDGAIHYLNIGSIIFFLLGLIALVYFLWTNTNYNGGMSEDKKTKAIVLTEGARVMPTEQPPADNKGK